MIKWVIVAVLVWVAWTIWRQGRVAAAQQRREQQAAKAPQEMVSCAVCAVHLPRGEAVSGADGRLYCTQEHRIAGDRGK